MNDIAIAFDYSLVDRDAEDRLKEIKVEITDITGNAGIQIGARLTEAQKLFSRRGKSGAEGGFIDWVKNEVGMERGAAYNLISIYSRCLENNDFHICGNHFSKSIQARLASPSTPDSVIKKAREIAESGETLTVAQVEEMKRKAKAEALAESEKEKADLKSKIALTESQKESWRKQAIEKEKARKAAEDAAVIKSSTPRFTSSPIPGWTQTMQCGLSVSWR